MLLFLMTHVAVVLLLTVVCAAAFVAALAPPFWTLDSYGYLVQSIAPTAGHPHPMGFGLLLRGLARLADVTSPHAYGDWFVTYNVACAVAFLYCLMVAAVRLDRGAPIHWDRAILAGSLAAVVWPGVLAGIIFLVNGVWTEMTVFMQLGVLTVAVTSLAARWRLSVAPWVIVAAVCAYQTRRQMGVVPPLFIIVGGLLWLKSRGQALPAGAPRPWQWGALGLVTLLALGASSRLEARLFPPSPLGQRTVANLLLMQTMACTLRCHSALRAADCATPEGREQVEATDCSDVATGRAGLKPPPLSPRLATATLLGRIGWPATLRFCLEAPLRYLGYPPVGTELGAFQFGAPHPPEMAPAGWPDVARVYGPYFDRAPVRPSGVFMALHGIIAFGYGLWLYHVLAGATVLACVGALLWSREPTVLLLCLLSVSLFLSFALLNPITPLRYLMQCIVPGIAGLSLGGIEWVRARDAR
jgi:hypothetical protein